MGRADPFVKGGKVIRELLGTGRKETHLKDAEGKVIKRPKGQESLEADQFPEELLSEEPEVKVGPDQIDPPDQPKTKPVDGTATVDDPVPDSPGGPVAPSKAQVEIAESEGQRKVWSKDPEQPTTAGRAATEDEAFDTGSPLNDDELESLLDAAEKPMDSDPEYTNMNLNRVNTIEDIGSVADNLIRITTERGKGMRDRTTFKKVKKDSSDVAWGTVVKKRADGTPLNIEEIDAVREVEARLMSDLKGRAAKLKQDIADGLNTQNDIYMYKRDAAVIMAISRYVRGEVRRAAQIVSAQRMVAGNSSVAARERQAYMEGMMMAGDDLNKMLDNVIASNTADDVLNALDHRTGWQKARSRMGNVWYNVVLSGFALFKAATAGVFIGKVLLPAERLVAAAIMKVRPSMADNQPAYNAKVHAGEAVVELFGWAASMRDMLKPLFNHLQDPSYDLGRAKLQKPAMPGEVRNDTIFSNLPDDAPASVRYLAQVVDAGTQDGSMRLMKMNDWIVRSSIGMSRAKAMGYRVALNEGLTDPKEIIKRIDELLVQMPDEMYDDMIQAGDTATLMQQLSKPSTEFISLINNVPFAKYILPFMRTALAALEVGLERMPLIGQKLPRTKAAWEKGGAARADVISKQIVGTSIMMMGAYMYSEGKATSGITLTKAQLQARRTLGYQELALITGEGNSYSLNFASPMHELLMIGVSLAEFWDYANEGIPPEDPRYKTWEEVGMALGETAIWSFVDMYLNKSVGRSMRELMEAIDKPETAGKYKTMRTITPLMVPVAGMGHVVSAVDPTWRRVPAGTFFEQMQGEFQKRVPWMSRELYPRRGFFGEPQVKHGFLLGALSYREGDPNAEVAHELFVNDVPLRMPSRHLTINGIRVDLDIEISPETIPAEVLEQHPEMAIRGWAYDRYSEIRGKLYASHEDYYIPGVSDPIIGLNGFIKLDAYKNANLPIGPPDDEGGEFTKGALLKSHMMLLNKVARLQFYDELQDKFDIYGLTDQLKRNRAEAGIQGMDTPGNVIKMEKIESIKAEDDAAYLRRMEASQARRAADSPNFDGANK